MFAREDGTDLSPAQVTKVFGRLSESAGLRRVRLHDLRHAAASLMLAGGVDVAVVSKRLEHSSVRVTSDVYGHLLAGVGRQAADVAEALVPPRATTRRPDAPTSRPQRAQYEAAPPAMGEAADQRGAACRNRTDDLLITSEMLYRLS